MSRIPNRFLDIKEVSGNQIEGDSVGAEKSLGKWVTYADAAASTPVDGTGGSPSITLQRTTTSGEVLNGSASFEIVKAAANEQGEGVSLTFSTDRALRAKPCKIEFNYQATANFVYGSSTVNSDIMVFVYDVTNATLITPYPNYLDGSGKFQASFQCPSNTDSLRLIFHVATTSALAYDFQFDNVFLGESPSTYIPLDSDWENLTGITGSWVSNTTYTGKIKKDSDSADLNILVSVSGAPTSAALTVTLPFTINTSKLLSTAGGASHLGLFTVRDVSASITYVGQVTYTSNNTISLIADVGNAAGNSASVTQAVPMTFASGDFIDIKIANLPVLGWTSGFISSSIVGQNVPAILRTFKNAGAVTANTTIPTWTTVSKDTVGGFDSSTGEYTVKVPGNYRASLKVNTTSGTPVASIYKNGTEVDEGLNSGTKSVVNCILADLVVGDVITARIDTSLTIASDNVSTTFELEKIETPQATLAIPRSIVYTARVSSAGVVSAETSTFGESNWINGNASISGTSTYALTFTTGLFKTTPNILLTYSEASDAANRCIFERIAATTSGVSVRTIDASAGTASAADFIIMAVANIQ